MPSSKKSAFKGLKVLITSGPTSVPIDEMRVITNRSTGEMGRLLAAAFARNGAAVTLLEGAATTSVTLPASVVVNKFYFYAELAELLRREICKPYGLIVHVAAVSDFQLKKPFKGKLASRDKLTLELVPVRKLISGLKAQAGSARLVGFKYEPDISSSAAIGKATDLIKKEACDLVVLNENTARGYRAVILSADGSMTGMVHTKAALVDLLLRAL
ncbi:MAG: hypothetical protein HQL20_05495 [Candidatus Omnitrophica bacterium]|nr:hypothetical protein [Candidatus Omnitrophota bacterium]